MMKQNLIETVTFTPLHTLTEEVDGKKYFVVEGRVQFADKPNANKRIYPRKLWETILSNQTLQENIASRKVLGTLDHPVDGKTTLENASHLITGLQLKEDGEVIGRIQVLNTPKGQILRALCEDNVSVGASSRGTGSLKPSTDGRHQIVQDDFMFETIDMVYNPSTPGAYPKPVYESTDSENNIKENLMNASDRFADLETRAAKALSIRSKGLETSARGLVESSLTSFMLEASKLSSEAPEVSKLAENLINDLSKKRNELRTLTETEIGDADHGVMRYPVFEPPPPPGEGGHIVDPAAIAVPSEMELMITSLVNEAEENEKADEDDEDDEEEKKKKKKKDDGEKEEQMESFAASILKNKAYPKAARGLAAAYLNESTRRKNEINAFKKIVTRMQEKFDAALADGKIVVESADEQLAFKYKLSTDVLKEVVRRYHVNEAYHYAKTRLAETGLANNQKAVAVVAESLKTTGTKSAIEETLVGFAKVSGIDLSKEPRPPSSLPVPVVESTDTKRTTPAAPPSELPLKLEGQIAKLNESTIDSAPSHAVSLANRLDKALAGSRSK
jgi:hypothetical protein